MTPIETVQQIYAAFGRGDVPAILGMLADDVDWEHDTFPNPIPYLQPLKGRDQVPRFFQALNETIEITSFVPTTFMASGNTVVDLVDLEFTVRANGKRVIERNEVHIWRLNDRGLVQRFRHRADTFQQAMALKGD